MTYFTFAANRCFSAVQTVVVGPLRHFAATQQLSRFQGIADMVGPAAGLVPVENDPRRTLRWAIDIDNRNSPAARRQYGAVAAKHRHIVHSVLRSIMITLQSWPAACVEHLVSAG